MPTYFQIRRLKIKKKFFSTQILHAATGGVVCKNKRTQTYYFSVEAGIVTSELRLRRKRTSRTLDDTRQTEIDIRSFQRERETAVLWAFLHRILYPINGQWAST